MQLISCNSLFGGESLESQLSSLYAQNISRQSPLPTPPPFSFSRTFIHRSEFDCVVNAIDGTIVNKFSQISHFSAVNTTFVNGEHTDTDFTTSQTLDDLSNTFTNCTFLECHSENGGSLSGDYTIASAAVRLSLVECVFRSSSSIQNGGAVSFLINSDSSDEIRHTISITKTNFFGCSATKGSGGCLFISIMGGSGASIEISIVDSIVQKSSAGGEGGFLAFDEAIPKTTSLSSITVNNCQFTDVSADKSGGVFNFKHKCHLNVNVGVSSFTEIRTGQFGGIFHSQPDPSQASHQSTITFHHTSVTDTFAGQSGSLLHLDTTDLRGRINCTFEDVSVSVFDSVAGGSLINVVGLEETDAFSCFITNCSFSRECSSRTFIISQQAGNLKIESTLMEENDPVNEAMIGISTATRLSLISSNFISSSNRKSSQRYQIVRGPIHPNSLSVCRNLLFSVHTPTCDGYLFSFSEFPTDHKHFFESCIDVSTHNFLSSLIGTSGEIWSIELEKRTFFVNEINGVDRPTCGLRTSPCKSLSFQLKLTQTTPYSITTIGDFSRIEQPITFPSPCSGFFSANEQHPTGKDRSSFFFLLSTEPILEGPNNSFELYLLHLNFECTQPDSVFFKVGQGSLTVAQTLMSYSQTLKVTIFQVTPSRRDCDSKISIVISSQTLNNIVVLSGSPEHRIIEDTYIISSTFEGSSTFVQPGHAYTVEIGAFRSVICTGPLIHLTSASFLSMTSFSFESCRGTVRALIVVENNATLEVASSVFSKCTGVDAGIILVSGTEDSHLYLVKCTFSGNTASGDLREMHFYQYATSRLVGNDMSLHNPQMNITVEGCRSSSLFPRVVVGLPPNEHPSNPFLMEQTRIYLNPIGEDNLHCHDMSRPCKTFQFSIGITPEIEAEWETTWLHPFGYFQETDITVRKKQISIDGLYSTQFSHPEDSAATIFDLLDSIVHIVNVSFLVLSDQHGQFIRSVSSQLSVRQSVIDYSRFHSKHQLNHFAVNPLFLTVSGSIVLHKVSTDGEKMQRDQTHILATDETDVNFRDFAISRLYTTESSALVSGIIRNTCFSVEVLKLEVLESKTGVPLFNLTIVDAGEVILEAVYINFVFRQADTQTPLPTIFAVFVKATTSTQRSSDKIHFVIDKIVAEYTQLDWPGSVISIHNTPNIPVTVDSPTQGLLLSGLLWDSCVEWKDERHHSLLSSFIEEYGVYHVKPDDQNIKIACGTSVFPCVSVDHPLLKIHPDRADPFKLVFDSSLVAEGSITDTHCNFVEGSFHTLSVSETLLVETPAFLVHRSLTIINLYVSLPESSTEGSTLEPVISCVGGSFKMAHVTMFQPAQRDPLLFELLKTNDTEVKLEDCEFSRINTQRTIVVVFFNNTKPSFFFQNVTFENLRPSNAGKIKLWFAKDAGKLDLTTHFSQMSWDTKHSDAYILVVGKKQSSFLYRVIVHPAIWVLIGFGGVLAVGLAAYVLCTPAFLPAMLCCRRYRNRTDPENRTRFCKFLQPDGGLGTVNEEPWWEIGRVNGEVHQFVYGRVKDSHKEPQKRVVKDPTEESRLIGKAPGEEREKRVDVPTTFSKQPTQVQAGQENRATRRRETSGESDSDSEDIFLSSESSEDEEL